MVLLKTEHPTYVSSLLRAMGHTTKITCVLLKMIFCGNDVHILWKYCSMKEMGSSASLNCI